MRDEFRDFVRARQAQVTPVERAANLVWWEAMTTGDDAPHQRQTELQTKVETTYRDPKALAFLKTVRASSVVADPPTRGLSRCSTCAISADSRPTAPRHDHRRLHHHRAEALAVPGPGRQMDGVIASSPGPFRPGSWIDYCRMTRVVGSPEPLSITDADAMTPEPELTVTVA